MVCSGHEAGGAWGISTVGMLEALPDFYELTYCIWFLELGCRYWLTAVFPSGRAVP